MGGGGVCLLARDLTGGSRQVLEGGGGLRTSCAITCESNLFGVEAVGCAVCVEPLDGGVGLLNWDGVLRFWGGSVVDEEDANAGLMNEVEDKTLVRDWAAEDPATA